MNFGQKSFNLSFFQRGTPMNVGQKSFKISFFSNGYPYEFWSKIVQNKLFSKGYPYELVKYIFGFILQEHSSQNGTRYFRISMPIAVRVLTHLHDEHDNPNLANWIEYPYSLD